MDEARMEIIPIDSIHIGKRIRKDLGDLRDLAEKIERVGLLEPVVVMQCADGAYELISGLRRIRAFGILNRIDIKAHILSPEEAEEKLFEMEVYENDSHKAFTAEEIAGYAPTLRTILTEKAKIRKSRYSPENRAKMLEWDSGPTQEEGRVRDIAAKRFGMRSGRQLDRLEKIAEKRPDLLTKIGAPAAEKPLTITRAYKIATGDDQSPPKPPKKVIPIPDHPLAGIQIDPLLDAALEPPLPASDADLIDSSGFVRVASVDMGRFKPINPNVIPGNDHVKLMRNPTYAALFEKFQEAAQLVNDAVTEMRRRCEMYERQIRAYEENKLAMGRDIERLTEANAELRVRLGETIITHEPIIITQRAGDNTADLDGGDSE